MSDALSITFAALSDPTRRAILAALIDGEKTVNELVADNRLSQPAISKHLKVLEAARLVSRRKLTRTRPCKLELAPLRQALDWIEIYRRRWEVSFDAMDEIITHLGQATKHD